MKKEQIKQVNFLLAAIATHYMECDQGRILYAQSTIINRLEELGEVELYVAHCHFDVAQARAEARMKKCGEWTITLKVIAEDEIFAIIKKTKNDAKAFPFDRLFSWKKVLPNDNVFSSKLDNNV